MSCVEDYELVEARINRVLTQYRESPNLLFLLRSHLRQVEIVHQALCDMPEQFDIETAVGDQLTIVGKRLGFPRCHCVCDVQPVYGFDCGDDGRAVVGACDAGTWADCGDDGVSEICISDDDIYRSLLKARRYQMLARYSWEDLQAALQTIYGPQARVLDAGRGRVVLGPLRELSALEVSLLQIVPRVLPVAPGIATRWHFGTRPIAGFGEGWGGACELESADGGAMVNEDGEQAETENGDQFTSGPIYLDADWLCEIDVKPYSC